MLFAHAPTQSTTGYAVGDLTKALALAGLAMLTPGALAQLPCSYEVDIVFGPACGDDLSNVDAFGISEEGDIAGDFAWLGAGSAFAARFPVRTVGRAGRGHDQSRVK